MGRVASALDNAMMESFFGTLQLDLLDRQPWATRAELAWAIFEWIEGWYNPRRRHTSIGNLSAVDYEMRPTANTDAGMMPFAHECSEKPGQAQILGGCFFGIGTFTHCPGRTGHLHPTDV